MNELLSFIGGFIQDESQARIVFIALVTLAFFGLGAAVGLVLMGISDPVRRRLFPLIASDTDRDGNTAGARLARRLQPISEYVLPAAEKERSKMQLQLVHGGFRSPGALTVFYAVKTALAIALPVAVLLTAPLIPNATTQQILFAAVVLAGIGVFLPNMFLHNAVEKRKKRLRNGFPDALDLLVVCVESGLGLSSAIARVAEELAVSHGELADELALVNSEMRAGIERTTALRNLAERTGLEDIRGLVTLLSQSMRFGTSIADTLRVYAEEFRDKRTQLAEEQAAKVGTKLIFPLVLCLFPAFFVVAIGPAILKVLVAVSRI